MSYRLYRPDKDDSITTSSSCSSRGKQSRPIRMTSSPCHTHINSTSSDMRSSTGTGAGAGTCGSMSGNCSISGAGSSSSSSSSLGTIFGGATSSFEFPELYPMGRSAAASTINKSNSSSSGDGSVPSFLYIGVEFLTSTALRYVLI